MTKKYCDVITDNVARVREGMANAAAKAGRDVREVTLVGVTKTRTAEAVAALIAAGVTDIGENRVQELLQKAPALRHLPHTAHLIGHLQRNKAKFLPSYAHMVQSVGSVQTVAALQKAFEGAPEQLDVLIEVNIGAEDSKSGAAAADVPGLAESVLQAPALRLRGLMAIPPFTTGEAVRRYFEQMYHLFVDIQGQTRDNDTVNVLSMGMSSDYQYAIQEGATMVRVGTGLFSPGQT